MPSVSELKVNLFNADVKHMNQIFQQTRYGICAIHPEGKPIERLINATNLRKTDKYPDLVQYFRSDKLKNPGRMSYPDYRIRHAKYLAHKVNCK